MRTALKLDAGKQERLTFDKNKANLTTGSLKTVPRINHKYHQENRTPAEFGMNAALWHIGDFSRDLSSMDSVSFGCQLLNIGSRTTVMLSSSEQTTMTGKITDNSQSSFIFE